MQALDFLDSTRLWRNSLLDWLLALGIAAAILLVLLLIRAVVVRRLGRIAERTDTDWDDFVVALAKRTSSLLVALVALYLGSRSLSLPGASGVWLKGAAALAVLLQVGLWGSLALDFWLGRARARRLAEDAGSASLLGVIRFVGLAVLWSLLLLVGLDNFGVNITALVAGLGIGGIAIALALQNILGDLLASLSIVLDKPFLVGDVISVGDLTGTVEHIGLKTTRLRNLSGEEVIFPNGELLTSRIHNWRRMTERRAVLRFGVVYGTPLEALREIPDAVRAMIEGLERVRFDRVFLVQLGASSLDFEVVYWSLSPAYVDYLDRQQQVLLGILSLLAERGVEVAFPTQTLIVSGQLAAADGVHPAKHPETEE